jgi:lysophospholipase L1-like esterase
MNNNKNSFILFLASLFLYLLCPVIQAQADLSDSITLSRVTARDSGSRPIKILPLGDSITDSYRGKASYRRLLWHKLKAAGYNVDFVGRPSYRHSTVPAYLLDYDIDHEGHSGWETQQILHNISVWMNDFTADIVLLHIGTNDLDRGRGRNELVIDTVNQTLNEIDGIIKKLREKNSSIVILLAKIIPMRRYDTAVFNDKIDAFVSTRTTSASPIIVVDQYSGFNPHVDNYDNYHPNEGGENKMANKWFQALEPFLSKVTNPTFLLPDNKWNQISLPMNPGNQNTVANVFGDDGLGVYDTDWVMFSYNANAGNYIKHRTNDTLRQGLGYWIIQTTGSNKILKMPLGSTETSTTNQAGCFIEDCFQIPLPTKAGTLQWNMMGYPFAKSGLLSNSRIVAATAACNSGCILEDAENNGIFHNILWNFNGSNYIEVTTSGGALNPWLGYWSATLNNAEGKNPSLLISKGSLE